MEDEDAQDLNNSMVTDLVAKILDDDPIITEETYSNHYNGNPRHYVDVQSSRMLKGRNGTNNHHDNVLGSQPYHLYSKISAEPCSTLTDESQRDFVNMYSGLNNMTLNDCIARTLEKESDYNNGSCMNAHRSSQLDQQRPRPTNDISNARNYVPMQNGLLTTTNGLNYGPQPSNWSEQSHPPDYTNDIFGNYQHIENSPNPDMNFNTIALSELGQPLSQNPYNNQALNIQDSYNLSANNHQHYRPSSAMTEHSVDSGFLSNSPLQHFSPPDTASHNCLSNNYSRNNHEDLHDNGSLNLANLAMHNETLYLQQQQQQQQQQQNYKLERQIDQNYKALMNRYLSLNEFNLPPPSDATVNDCNPMTINHNQRIDDSLLNVLSPKSKHRDNQSSKVRGYPRNLVPQLQAEQLSTKYNYQINNGYQCYTANNSDSTKIISPSAAYQPTIKRQNSTCPYKIDPYDLANELANERMSLLPGGAQLAQQFARASMDSNVFNQIMKQRNQQMQRISGVPASLLFNARSMRGSTAGCPPVFPSVLPVVQMPVAPMPVLFGGLNLRNGPRSVRRAGSSSILHMRLDQTFEQFQQLEKERKKCEAALADHFPGKRVSSANNIPTPRLQGNSSRADRLIVDHFQEHARVITLIAKVRHSYFTNLARTFIFGMLFFFLIRSVCSIKYALRGRKGTFWTSIERHTS